MPNLPFGREAFEELSNLFSRNEDFRDVDEALTTLEDFPRLAPVSIGNQKPLCYLLKSPAARNLSTIQTIYNLYPSITFEQDVTAEEETTPLHVACRSEYASDQVIDFIFQKNPAAASIRNKKGLSPLVYLFWRGEPRLLVLQRLLQAGGCVKGQGVDLLATAMSVGCDKNTYELLWEYYPKSSIFRLCSDLHLGDDKLDQPEAEMLARMLSDLSVLVCQPREWNPQAMDLLAKGLATDDNRLEELDLSLDSDRMSPESCELWRRVLSQNTSLRKVKIRAEPHNLLKRHGRVHPTFRSFVSNHKNDAHLLESIMKGLSANHTLKELELSCFKFPEIALTDINANHKCTLQRLYLTDCYFASYDWLKNGFLTHAPLLQELALTFRQEADKPRPPDMTSTLVWILSTMALLQRLTVGKTDPSHTTSVARKVPEVLGALRHNKSLKSFSIHSLLEHEKDTRERMEEILQSGTNSTLQEIGYDTFGPSLYSSWDDCSENVTPERLGRIPYYLQWNRFGRKSLRHSGVNRTNLVQALVAINSASELSVEYQRNLLFDVLLETTGLWS